LAMMDPADRDNELVAHSSSECARLCKGQVMRVRWDAAANKTSLPKYEFPMVLVAQPNRFAQGPHCVRARLPLGQLGRFLACFCVAFATLHHSLLCGCMRRLGRAQTTRRPASAPIVSGQSIRRLVRTIADLGKPRRKGFLY